MIQFLRGELPARGSLISHYTPEIKPKWATPAGFPEAGPSSGKPPVLCHLFQNKCIDKKYSIGAFSDC
jgi:hypothetical protein